MSFAATDDWKAIAQEILRAEDISQAQKEFKKRPSLKNDLKRALSNKDKELALKVIEKLNLVELSAEIVKTADPTNLPAITALAQLASDQKGKEAFKYLKQINLEKSKLPTSLTLKILNSYKAHKEYPNADLLYSFLEANDQRLREPALDFLIAKYNFKSENIDLDKITKALSLSPYTLREKCLSFLETLSIEVLRKEKSALKQCADQEKKAEIKFRCQNLANKLH